MMHVGGILSTVGDILSKCSVPWGIMINVGKYLEYHGVFSAVGIS